MKGMATDPTEMPLIEEAGTKSVDSFSCLDLDLDLDLDRFRRLEFFEFLLLLSLPWSLLRLPDIFNLIVFVECGGIGGE